MFQIFYWGNCMEQKNRDVLQDIIKITRLIQNPLNVLCMVDKIYGRNSDGHNKIMENIKLHLNENKNFIKV
jgi:hypothetical protein